MPILRTAYRRPLEDPEEFCSTEYQIGIPFPIEVIKEEEEVTFEKTSTGFWNALFKISKQGK